MQLTDEQNAIMATDENIKINAVAGSGKTTTLVEYAKTRPVGSKILYLAFNKSVEMEGKQKFSAAGLSNVAVYTAHSLALRHIGRRKRFEIKGTGYKAHEIKDLLKLKPLGSPGSDYLMANHVLNYATYFCNSSVLRFEELEYMHTLSGGGARKFVEQHQKALKEKTYEFLSKMWKNEIPVTHDFYLKMFHLSSPVLNYDYILFDEAQDASPVMLDVFLRQKNAVKLIVGDQHQQIYSWRYASNALEEIDFREYRLTRSFRFHSGISELARKVLSWKRHLEPHRSVAILGNGEAAPIRSRAVLARTNIALLRKAIDILEENPDLPSIYFEGKLANYTFARSGSIYDVYNLYQGNREKIRNPLIAEFEDMDYLKEYAKQAEDVELAMLIDIVEEYGKKTISLLHRIKEKTEDEDREKASYIFSTVHKSKGMEYDEVILEEDFWNEEQIEKFAKSPKPGKTYSSVLEEVNLLYVAVTRAKTSLQIPESLLPKDYFVPGDDLVKSIHNTNKGFSGEIRKKKREVWMDQADDDLNAYLKKKGLG